LVDQGVIISFLGPEKLPEIEFPDRGLASEKSQISFSMSSGAGG
jgi:hypothetical protein